MAPSIDSVSAASTYLYVVETGANTASDGWAAIDASMHVWTQEYLGAYDDLENAYDA